MERTPTAVEGVPEQNPAWCSAGQSSVLLLTAHADEGEYSDAPAWMSDEMRHATSCDAWFLYDNGRGAMRATSEVRRKSTASYQGGRDKVLLVRG